MNSRESLTPFGMDLYAYLTQHGCITYKEITEVFYCHIGTELFDVVIDEMVSAGYLTRKHSGGWSEEICLV